MGLSLRVLLQKQDLLTWIKWLGALILVGLFHAILLSILVLSCHKLCIVNVLFATRYNKFLFFAHGNSSLRECLRHLHACESQLFYSLLRLHYWCSAFAGFIHLPPFSMAEHLSKNVMHSFLKLFLAPCSGCARPRFDISGDRPTAVGDPPVLLTEVCTKYPIVLAHGA